LRLAAFGSQPGATVRAEKMARCSNARRCCVVQDFKQLRVWDAALSLALSVDDLTKKMRRGPYAAFRSQVFRAALSIPSNIAEGRRKKTDKEFARFLNIAAGSSSELESHLIFGRKARLIGETEFLELVNQTIVVRKMIFALIRRLSEED
jgi:four helix bundle protein